MLFQSGDKTVQLIGCLFALIVAYYGILYKNTILITIGVVIFTYDGYLVAFEK